MTATVSTMAPMAITAGMAPMGEGASKGRGALPGGPVVTVRSGTAPRRVCVEGTPSPSGMTLEWGWAIRVWCVRAERGMVGPSGSVGDFGRVRLGGAEHCDGAGC